METEPDDDGSHGRQTEQVKGRSDGASDRVPRFGAMRGRLALTPAFFQPLPDDYIAAWEGDEPN